MQKKCKKKLQKGKCLTYLCSVNRESNAYTAKRPEKYELSCKYTKKIVPLQSYWESSEPNRLIQVKHIHYAYKIISLHAMH